MSSKKESTELITYSQPRSMLASPEYCLQINDPYFEDLVVKII